ncbi:MAG TPA: class I SAM-dependent methyltransferase [Mycobacteriales bacterium]|nr:class I SAM-dependent methyltransferase [Mycobacteriales bacterium]
MNRQPGSPTAFDGLVDDYDTSRPSYPDALFDALPPLAGADVVELGAGTGISTRALLARGAHVLATDLGPKVLRHNVNRSPGLPAVVARAEALPFRAASADLVCGAQMWHWVDAARASAEVVRVLRPEGALAVWWNEVFADGIPWWDAQQTRLEAANPRYTRGYREQDYGAALRATGRFRDVSAPVRIPWSRELDLSTYLAWLRSKSYVDAIPRPAYDDFLAAEAASLTAAFPDGMITEPFVTTLWVARR